LEPLSSSAEVVEDRSENLEPPPAAVAAIVVVELQGRLTGHAGLL
jgi:hypothetical protein